MHLNNKTTTLTNKNQQKQKGTIYDNSFTSKPAKKCVAPRQRKLSLHTKYQKESIMSIRIAGVDLFSQGLENEYRISVLEKVLDKIITNNPSVKISEKEIEEIRKEVIFLLQKKYPEAGINNSEGK